jgi:hypothetical protein
MRAALACRINDQFGLWLSLVERLVRDERALRAEIRFPLVKSHSEPSGKGSHTREKAREQISARVECVGNARIAHHGP